MRKIITEINRIREMIGVSLIVEGIGDVLNIFTNLGKKSIKELSNEEQEIISKLIKDSAEIQRAGIRSIDDVMSDAGKQLLLKTIRENSVAVKSTFNKIVSDYAKTSMAMINSNLKSIPDLETELSKLKAGSNTALDIIQKIEKEGTENLDTLQLAALKKTLTDAKTTFAGNLRMTTYLDDVSEQVDGVIKAKNADVNIESAGTKTDGFGDEFISDPKIKNITDSQKSKIESDISSMTDEEVASIVEEAKNKTGRFSPGTLSANGFTKENIERFGNAVVAILKIPPKILTSILTELGFKVQVSAVKAYGSLILVGSMVYFTYQWYNGEFSLSEALPKIDTADENCVQNIVGYDTLTKDMKNFVAIEFGCRKTKDIDVNSTDKITGFANVGTNQICVIYSNANCNKIYEISAGGVGSLIKNTCEESNMGGGEEENRESL
jgi:hypothetical protein